MTTNEKSDAIDKREPRPELVPIGARIRERRLVKEKTQQWIADRMDLTKKSISNYELGISSIPLDQLVKLAGLLEVPLIYFFDEERIELTSEDKEWLEHLGRKLETIPESPAREFEKQKIKALVDSFVDVAIKFTTQAAPADEPNRGERPEASLDQRDWKQTFPY